MCGLWDISKRWSDPGLAVKFFGQVSRGVPTLEQTWVYVNDLQTLEGYLVAHLEEPHGRQVARIFVGSLHHSFRFVASDGHRKQIRLEGLLHDSICSHAPRLIAATGCVPLPGCS
jgi:hypothetical protein